jgi:hypothetical protein
MLRPEGKPSSFVHPERILYSMTKGERFGAHLLHGPMMCFEEPVPVIESEIKSVAPSQASSCVCSTGSAADSDSSINADDSSSSGDNKNTATAWLLVLTQERQLGERSSCTAALRIREEISSEEPVSPVYLSLLSASARPIQKSQASQGVKVWTSVSDVGRGWATGQRLS